MVKYYAAVDIGAESGRVMLGTLEGGNIRLEEVHRFSNGPVEVLGSLYWDVLGLFAEIKKGLRELGRRKVPVSGVGIDT